ncbi:MAG TPA: hypothetical protein P5080_01305 [Candidatus Paceibacterota bacterium]|nr:hypothetical protein [Candidatus Pacearchaeota archaeon]HRZ50773.1 hypothetical protein [Candidatus Paceibacterota bacterium]HSA36330.1 hypothetical protein [Candidatus Paceibacterota bacterium]
MDYYEEEKEPKNHEWAATSSLSIGLVEIGGILTAYLIKYFGHYLYGINIPLENGWADNVIIDGMINGLIQGMNSMMHAAGPVIEEFFLSFFTETFAWVFISLSIFGFIFSLIGLRSAKARLAMIGMFLSLAVIAYNWWFISQIAK